MKLFGQRNDGALVTYEGMDQSTVESMLALQQLTITWMDETTFNSLFQQLIAR